MIESITFDRYRAFDKYSVSGLSPVNLIVGRNSCGKTSVLEAVQLLASGGDPAVLTRIAWQRGEVAFLPEDVDRPHRDANPDISHFFHGHDFKPGATFRLKAENEVAPLQVRITTLDELEPNKRNQRLFDEFNEFRARRAGAFSAAYAVVFEQASHPRARAEEFFPVSEDGAFFFDFIPRYRRSPIAARKASQAVQFITPDSLEPRSMSDMWNKVLMDGREESVIKAMRILDDDLTDIFFLSGERTLGFGGRTGVLLGFENQKRRSPLGSHGEGMRRLLALSLSLAQSAGGILLVDEIDTGLHWSIMGDMWRLVVSAAMESDTQVFATTHSLDCLRGIAWMCENYPALADRVTVHKIDRSLEQSVRFDAPQIHTAVEQEIEVR